jgi:HTH-type transcriptional regulator / antitoxin HigA
VAADFCEASAYARGICQRELEMNAAVATDYGALLSEMKPEVIQTEEQNQRYIQQLEQVAGKPAVSAAEEKLIALLTVLIEEYENKHYSVPAAGPLDILRHLMEVHNLRQRDLVDVFGAESTVSDVLNGKRDITKEQIRRLSNRFHVSPVVFF